MASGTNWKMNWTTKQNESSAALNIKPLAVIMGPWSLYLSVFETATIRRGVKRKRLYYLWAAWFSLQIVNSPHTFWYTWEFSLSVVLCTPPRPLSNLVILLVSHHLDTFSNQMCSSTERTVMANEVLVSWRINKNGNYNNLGRSRTQLGKSVPVISKGSSQMVWVQEIQFHKNFWSTYCVSGTGICHWTAQCSLLPGAYELLITPGMSFPTELQVTLGWNNEGWQESFL